MLNEKLNELIKDAMKSKDQVRVGALRSVKAAFMNFQTAKNAKPLDSTAEIQIIKKLVSQRKESVEMYKTANRQDLVDQETAEINILTEFLPAEVTRGELEAALEKIEGIDRVQKNMSLLIKTLKGMFPTADGKLISEVVKESLK